MVVAIQRMVAAIQRIQRTGQRWLPLLAWMVAIYIASDQPSQTIPHFGSWDILLKKGSHFFAYGLMAALSLRVTADFKRPYRWAFLIAAVYAISDEWHQTFVPGRDGRLADVIIDHGGSLAALIMLRYRQRRHFQTLPLSRSGQTK
jgi:VanZ family protein